MPDETTEDKRPTVVVEGKSILEILAQLGLFGGIGTKHLQRGVAIGSDGMRGRMRDSPGRMRRAAGSDAQPGGSGSPGPTKA